MIKDKCYKKYKREGCYDKYKQKRKDKSVCLPDDTTLPFLAYGFFKPRQLAYSQIKGYVFNKPRGVTINFILNHINGIPILEHAQYRDNWNVDAYIMEFKYGKAADKAYEVISLSKNKFIYKWEVISIGGMDVNVLMNASDKSFPIYTYKWDKYDWREDPIYENTLEYLDKKIEKLKLEFNNDSNEENNFMRFIEVQSLYRTLWSALDRFISFRYGDYQNWNVRKLSEEHFFQEALKNNYNALSEQEFYGKDDYRNDDWDDEVFSAEDLRSYKLDYKQPTCSALYYYTLRNNVVHSGKMMPQEVNMVLNALLGLTEIFRHSIKVVKKKKY